MSTAAASLVETPRREGAGADSSSRFTYQHYWTVLRMIDLAEDSDANWRVVCEFHEDVVCIIEPEGRDVLELVQVKTRDPASQATWTATRLVERSAGKTSKLKASVLGELIATMRRLDHDGPKRAVVATNIPLRVRSDSDDLRILNSSTLSKFQGKCWSTVEEAIKLELGGKVSEDERQVVKIQKYFLDIGEIGVATRGRLSQYLEEALGQSGANVGPALRVLASEVVKRSNHPDNKDASLSWMRRRKAITRQQFHAWCSTLSQLPSRDRFNAWWPDAAQALRMESTDFRTTTRLRDAALKAIADLTRRDGLEEIAWNTSSSRSRG